MCQIEVCGTCVSDMRVSDTGASDGVCQIGVSDRHVGLVCQMSDRSCQTVVSD